MDVGEAAMACRERRDDVVDAAQVGPRERRRDVEEIPRVITERRVVNTTEQDRADRQCLQEAVERRLETPHARALVAREAAQKVVAADRQLGNGRLVRGPKEIGGLPREVVDRRTVDGTVLERY